MHKIIALISFCLLGPALLLGQVSNAGGGKKDPDFSRKATTITAKLNLSPDQAKAFWPLYQSYLKARYELYTKFMEQYGGAYRLDTLSRQQALLLADAQIIQQQQILDLRKHYHLKYKTVLPAIKLIQLYEMEKMPKGKMRSSGSRYR